MKWRYKHGYVIHPYNNKHGYVNNNEQRIKVGFIGLKELKYL